MSKKRSGAELVETCKSIHLSTSEILANLSLLAHKTSRSFAKKYPIFLAVSMLENRKFLSIDDGEIISDDLLARSSIGREVRLRTIDISKVLEKIGFTALGIAVTLDNSGIKKRGTCGRMTALEAARALEKYLKTLIEKELKRYPIFVSYVLEAHRGGMPHIHAMVFCLPLHLHKIAAILERHLSRKAVSVEVLSPEYLFKEGTGEWHLQRTTAQLIGYDVSKLLRKTTSENGKTARSGSINATR